MKKISLLFIASLSFGFLTSCNVDVKPVDPPVDDRKQLVLSGSYPTEFDYYDYFSYEGLIVTSENEVITDYQVSPFSQGNHLKEVGEFTVTISKENYKSASYQIIVHGEKQLFIESTPTNLNYHTGDVLDFTGLVVKDNRDRIVTDYTTSLENGSIIKRVGDINIFVRKEQYIETYFTIHVEPSGDHPVREDTDLKIYYINDTHGSYSRLDNYYEPGMSSIGAYIKADMANSTATHLILSGGDMFEGGYESNETNGYMMADAMNAIGFDAMALGNHEFDWGEEKLVNLIDRLDCPVLSSNVLYKDTNTRPSWAEPYTIIEKDDLKIGIVGGTQEGINSSIDQSVSPNFIFPKPNEYIKEFATYLRNEGCDLVLALFHDEGYDIDSETTPTKFDDITLINEDTGLPYVDAMFFSHDHQIKQGQYENSEGNFTPFIETGCNGRNIGELTFHLKGQTDSYLIDSTSIEMIPFKDIKGNLEEVDNIAKKEEYASIMLEADVVVYNFQSNHYRDEFANVSAASMYWYINNHISEFGGKKVYVASTNTGSVRATVYKGEMTRRIFVKVFPFDNRIVIQTCNSIQINRIISWYATYKEEDPVYDSGYTNAVTVSYVAEYRGGSYNQVSKVYYSITAKEILYQYLKNRVDPNL